MDRAISEIAKATISSGSLVLATPTKTLSDPDQLVNLANALHSAAAQSFPSGNVFVFRDVLSSLIDKVKDTVDPDQPQLVNAFASAPQVIDAFISAATALRTCKIPRALLVAAPQPAKDIIALNSISILRLFVLVSAAAAPPLAAGNDDNKEEAAPSIARVVDASFDLVREQQNSKYSDDLVTEICALASSPVLSKSASKYNDELIKFMQSSRRLQAPVLNALTVTFEHNQEPVLAALPKLLDALYFEARILENSSSLFKAILQKQPQSAKEILSSIVKSINNAGVQDLVFDILEVAASNQSTLGEVIAVLPKIEKNCNSLRTISRLCRLFVIVSLESQERAENSFKTLISISRSFHGEHLCGVLDTFISISASESVQTHVLPKFSKKVDEWAKERDSAVKGKVTVLKSMLEGTYTQLKDTKEQEKQEDEKKKSEMVHNILIAKSLAKKEEHLDDFVPLSAKLKIDYEPRKSIVVADPPSEGLNQASTEDIAKQIAELMASLNINPEASATVTNEEAKEESTVSGTKGGVDVKNDVQSEHPPTSVLNEEPRIAENLVEVPTPETKAEEVKPEEHFEAEKPVDVEPVRAAEVQQDSKPVDSKSQTETNAEPKAETELKPEAKLEPESLPEVKAESKPESKPEPEVQAEAKPEINLEPEVKSEAKPEIKPEPEVRAEAKSELKPDPEVKPEPKPEIRPEPEVKAETKPEVEHEAKPEVKPEAKPEVKAEVKPEVKPEAKPEVVPEPEVKAEPKPEESKPVEKKEEVAQAPAGDGSKSSPPKTTGGAPWLEGAKPASPAGAPWLSAATTPAAMNGNKSASPASSTPSWMAAASSTPAATPASSSTPAWMAATSSTPAATPASSSTPAWMAASSSTPSGNVAAAPASSTPPWMAASPSTAPASTPSWVAASNAAKPASSVTPASGTPSWMAATSGSTSSSPVKPAVSTPAAVVAPSPAAVNPTPAASNPTPAATTSAVTTPAATTPSPSAAAATPSPTASSPVTALTPPADSAAEKKTAESPRKSFTARDDSKSSLAAPVPADLRSASSANLVNGADKVGVLEMDGGVMHGGWKPYDAFLNGAVLTLKKQKAKKKEDEPTVVNMSEIGSITVEKKNSGFVLALRDGKKKIHFRGESDEDREAWIAAFRSAGAP